MLRVLRVLCIMSGLSFAVAVTPAMGWVSAYAYAFPNPFNQGETIEIYVGGNWDYTPPSCLWCWPASYAVVTIEGSNGFYDYRDVSVNGNVQGTWYAYDLEPGQSMIPVSYTVTVQIWYWDPESGQYWIDTTFTSAYADPAQPDPPTSCGDDRDNIIDEYRGAQVAWTPNCNDFATSGDSAHFTWRELNGGFAQGNQHEPWGIIMSALRTGLEATRTNYNRGGITLTSGYRCPVGNANVGGAPQSYHMHGRAADMYSADHPWTQTEFNRLRQAAVDTGNTIEALFWTTYADRHLHAAW